MDGDRFTGSRGEIFGAVTARLMSHYCERPSLKRQIGLPETFPRHGQTKSSKPFMCFCIQCQRTPTGEIRLGRLRDVCWVDSRTALCVRDSFMPI